MDNHTYTRRGLRAHAHTHMPYTRRACLCIQMVCENRIRGCDAVMRVDAARAHLDTCRHGPVQCAGCTETVSRCELPQHHVKCAVIAAVLGDDDDELDADPGHEDTIGISRQVRTNVLYPSQQSYFWGPRKCLRTPFTPSSSPPQTPADHLAYYYNHVKLIIPNFPHTRLALTTRPIGVHSYLPSVKFAGVPYEPTNSLIINTLPQFQTC